MRIRKLLASALALSMLPTGVRSGRARDDPYRTPVRRQGRCVGERHGHVVDSRITSSTVSEPGRVTYDLSKYTVLPGLIDGTTTSAGTSTATAVSIPATTGSLRSTASPPPECQHNAPRRLDDHRQSRRHSDAPLRDAIARGVIPGPSAAHLPPAALERPADARSLARSYAAARQRAPTSSRSSPRPAFATVASRHEATNNSPPLR